MAHEVLFNVPDRTLGKSDIEFKVFDDNGRLGTLPGCYQRVGRLVSAPRQEGSQDFVVPARAVDKEEKRQSSGDPVAAMSVGARAGSSRDTRRRFEQWAQNPTCEANTLSAVHNVPMSLVAKADGAESTFGQSPFALARGQQFERLLFRSGGSSMLDALRNAQVVPESAAGLADFRLRISGGRFSNLDESLQATRTLLRSVAARGRKASEPWLVAGATVRVPGGVMLPEAILVLDALVIDHRQWPRVLMVGESSVPDHGSYANPRELATARAQAGVYVHGLALVVEELGLSGSFANLQQRLPRAVAPRLESAVR